MAGLIKKKNIVRHGGKTVIKKKKKSTRKGFTVDAGGKIKKIGARERINRKKAANLSKHKRAGKKTVANLKRSKSNRKRKSLGFDK